MQPPPGPRGLAVLGFLGLGKGGGTLSFLEQTARRYGPISSFRLLNRRIYIVDDAELIKDILVTRQHSFERDAGAKLLRELVGDTLLTREEPAHKERRRMLQPAFHRDQIASYFRIMCEACQRMADSWTANSVIDVRAEMRKLTLDIVGACLFGSDFTDSAEAVSGVLQRVGRRSRWLAPIFVFLEPLFDAYRKRRPRGRSLLFHKEREELNAILRPVLERELAHTEGDRSMLNLLSGEEGILDEMVTFMLAGHETTATALTWAWYLLARNPAAAKMFAEELRNAPENLTLDTLPQLTYTGAVFQEAMRLYPPALAFARRTNQEITLGAYTIPKGASIFLSPYITQRNPLYFADPLNFDPLRWQNYTGPKFAYFPFGGGAKMCIGEPFARLEGVLALTLLGRRWKLESVDGESIEIGPGFLLRPEKPIHMRVVPNLLASTECASSIRSTLLPTG